MGAFDEACTLLSSGSEDGASVVEKLREGVDAIAPISALDYRYEAVYTRLDGLYYEVEDAVGDLVALRELVPAGVEGAIIGKALYDGAFTLAAALDVSGRDA